MSEQAQDNVETFSPDDELDLSGAGLQTQVLEWLIADATVEEHQDGQRWQIILQPVGQEVEGLPNNEGRDGGFLTHSSRPELVNMGRGMLKNVYKAALGTPKGRLSDLVGKTVSAQISESDTGFARFRRYKAAPNA